ncbi:MAG: hypothetical protein ACOZQL_04375 [Myxococcota bacterium]
MSAKYVQLRNQLTELLRMPTSDKLSLLAWFDEAQRLMRFVREERLEVPPFVHQWLAGADARAKDPLRAATENAELVKYLHALTEQVKE